MRLYKFKLRQEHRSFFFFNRVNDLTQNATSLIQREST